MCVCLSYRQKPPGGPLEKTTPREEFGLSCGRPEGFLRVQQEVPMSCEFDPLGQLLGEEVQLGRVDYRSIVQNRF